MQFVDFVGAMSSPINIEISPKYAAATMGATNCANNLTFYAISANIIGAPQHGLYSNKMALITSDCG